MSTKSPTPLTVAQSIIKRAGHDHSNARGHWPSHSIMTNGSDAYRAKPLEPEWVDVDQEIRQAMEDE